MIRDEKISLPRISQLDKRLIPDIIKGIELAESKLPANVSIRITQGLRTIAEQNALFAQGRTTPGKKVTNAKGGQSWHNFGLAFDIVLLESGVPNWSVNVNWKLVAQTFKDLGFVWGGDFKTLYDAPHFEKTFGQKLSDMKY